MMQSPYFFFDVVYLHNGVEEAGDETGWRVSEQRRECHSYVLWIIAECTAIWRRERVWEYPEAATEPEDATLHGNMFFTLAAAFPLCVLRLQDNYTSFCSLDSKGMCYRFEVSLSGPAIELHNCMAKLLAHPLQRPFQSHASYSLLEGDDPQDIEAAV